MSILWIASNLPPHPKSQGNNFHRKSVKHKPENKAKSFCLLCFHLGLMHLHSSLLGEVTFSSVKSCWLELAACVVREVLLLSLFVSPENKSDWLLLVLGVESSSGCFFWKSSKTKISYVTTLAQSNHQILCKNPHVIKISSKHCQRYHHFDKHKQQPSNFYFRFKKT